MKMIWDMQIPTTPKFLALALANYADKAGTCWPSYEALSERTGLCKRAIVDNVNLLREAGLFRVEKLQGNRHKYHFDLTLLEDAQKCTTCASALNAPRIKRTSRSAPDAPQSGTKCTSLYNKNESPKNPQGTPNIAADAAAAKKTGDESAKKSSEKPPKDSAPKAPRERDLLFDAIAEVCCLEPSAQGGEIGKAKQKLQGFKATPDEVRLYGQIYAKQHPIQQIPTWQELTKLFGIVRNPQAIERILGSQPIRQQQRQDTDTCTYQPLGGDEWN